MRKFLKDKTLVLLSLFLTLVLFFSVLGFLRLPGEDPSGDCCRAAVPAARSEAVWDLFSLRVLAALRFI